MADVVLVGGGTGGHIVPAIALAQALEARGQQTLLVTGARTIERRIVADYPFGHRRIGATTGFATGGWAAKLRMLLQLLPAFVAAWRHVRRAAPRYLVLTGGYVALPFGVAALLLRRPFFLVEPNAKAGRVTRLLSRFARAVASVHPNVFQDGETPVVSAVPVRPAVRAAATRRQHQSSPLRVLVLGGSQGALSLNTALPAALAGLEVEVLHVSGPGREAEARAAYAHARVAATVVDYLDNVPGQLAVTDLAVTRAGALTVAELAAACQPAVLVPYPFAADDHQTDNARWFAQLGGGVVVAEGPAFAERLRAAVTRMLSIETRQSASALLAGTKTLFAPEAVIDALEAYL